MDGTNKSCSSITGGSSMNCNFLMWPPAQYMPPAQPSPALQVSDTNARPTNPSPPDHFDSSSCHPRAHKPRRRPPPDFISSTSTPQPPDDGASSSSCGRRRGGRRATVERAGAAAGSLVRRGDAGPHRVRRREPPGDPALRRRGKLRALLRRR
jgi:hypothetical protein